MKLKEQKYPLSKTRGKIEEVIINENFEENFPELKNINI